MRIIRFAADGASKSLEVLADTGNPCALIVATDVLGRFNLGVTPGLSTNFRPLDGGWLRVQIPEINFDEDLLAYGSNAVAEAAQASHGDFEGLAGLPLLRMMEFGGDRDEFWIRAASSE